MKTKSFIIAGANSYLGKAFVEYLLKDMDTKLLLVTRRPQDFSWTQEVGEGRVAYMSGVDFTNEEDLKKMTKKADEFFEESFTVLTPIGYIRDHEPFEVTDLATAKRIFESNLIAVYAIAYAILPIMIKKGGGNFVVFSSNAVKYAYPYMAAFDASKAALENLVESIANEYAKDKIQANAIALPCLDHEQARALIPHGDFANWMKLEEVCRETLALLSDDLKYLNGNTIHLFKYSDTFFGKGYFERIRK